MTDEEWESLDPEYRGALSAWVAAEKAAWFSKLRLATVWGGVSPEVAAEAMRRFRFALDSPA